MVVQRFKSRCMLRFVFVLSFRASFLWFSLFVVLLFSIVIRELSSSTGLLHQVTPVRVKFNADYFG